MNAHSQFPWWANLLLWPIVKLFDLYDRLTGRNHPGRD